MRVLLTSHHFPPDSVAGVERITQALAAELVKGGDEVSVITRRLGPGTEPKRLQENLPDGTVIHRIAGGEREVDRFLVHDERLEELFEQTLIETGPEVVHVLHLLGLSSRLVEIARRHGAAVVISLQDFYFACPLYLLRKPSGELCAGPAGGRECATTCFSSDPHGELRWGLRAAYFRRTLGLAQRVICPSNYVADWFDEYGVERERIRMIANGVSLEPGRASLNGSSTPADRGSLNLAYLGSVVRHKGVHLILEALSTAAVEASELLVLGSLDDADYVQELVDQAETIPGLTLRLYGAYEPTELPVLLRDVDCVVTPSQWPETFAIVAREALTLGVPPIVSRMGGLQDAVVHGENGFIFDPDQPTELAVLLQRLVYDRDLLPRLRKAALKSRVLTVPEHVRAVRAVYEEALEQAAQDGAVLKSDFDELAFLHSALLDAGFGEAAPSPEAVERP